MFSKSMSHAMGRGGGGLPVMAYTGRLLQKEVPFRLLIHERGAISLFGVFLKCGEICHVSKRTKILKDALYGCERLRKLHDLVIYSD